MPNLCVLLCHFVVLPEFNRMPHWKCHGVIFRNASCFICTWEWRRASWICPLNIWFSKAWINNPCYKYALLLWTFTLRYKSLKLCWLVYCGTYINTLRREYFQLYASSTHYIFSPIIYNMDLTLGMVPLVSLDNIVTNHVWSIVHHWLFKIVITEVWFLVCGIGKK